MNRVNPITALVFRCPSCGSDLVESRDRSWTCDACGRAVPQEHGVDLLVRDPEALRERLDEARSGIRGDWYQAPQGGQLTGPYRHHILKRRKWVEQAIAAYKAGRDEPIRGLDLGCGDGTNIPWLAAQVDRLYASDYNLVRLARARLHTQAVRVFLADILDYPTQPDSFDLIFWNHVIEHIPDDVGALREVRRILKPGGLLILGTPNEGAAFWQWAYRFQPKMRATSDHVHFYTADSLRKKCIAAGFQVREIHALGWGVPHWSMDAAIRRFKWVDDIMESVGRRLLPKQATSLYLLLGK